VKKTPLLSFLAFCVFSFSALGNDIPVFTIGTIHSPSDSIDSVVVTACNFAATGFNDCFNADNNGSLATGTLAINPGDSISISEAAIANPLNFWENFFPYNTPHVVVRITSSQGQDCESNVVSYHCTSSSACPGLTFSTPVTCNFN